VWANAVPEEDSIESEAGPLNSQFRTNAPRSITP
jgi:hypothetical protein